jgi:hypothetical protein
MQHFFKYCLPVFGLLLTLTACDMPVNYRFDIRNATAEPWLLVYAVSTRQDSLPLPPGQTTTVVQRTQTAKARYDYYRNFKNILYTAQLVQPGSNWRINVADRRRWQLTWPRSDTGVYLLAIDSALFNKGP